MLSFSPFQEGREKGRSVMVGIFTEGTDSHILFRGSLSFWPSKDRAVEHDRSMTPS